MKYKQPSFLLAVILASAAPIFADKIPGESRSAARVTHFTHSDNASGLGSMGTSEENTGESKVKGTDVDSNDRHFSHEGNKGKSHEKGDGNTDGGGGSTTQPAVAVTEPGSQLLLLVGLAGLGIFFLRRNSFQNATE